MTTRWTLLLMMYLGWIGSVSAQNWKFVFKPDANINLHITQKDNQVFATKSYTSEDLFIRITDGSGRHTKYPFGNQTYLTVDLPSEGFIAVMSADSSTMTQYIYASESISRINFADNNTFFAYTERLERAMKNKVPTSEAPVFPTTTATVSANPGSNIAEDNPEFDPNRKLSETARRDAYRDVDEETANATNARIDALLEQMQMMNKKLNDLSKQVEDLKSVGTAAPVAAEAAPEAYGKSTSFIMAGTAGFYNISTDCDGCKVDKLSGIPAFPSFGVAFNQPNYTLAVLLSIGGQLHLPEPGRYRLRPSAGGKGVIIARKYAFSAGIFSTRSFDSILATAGIGIPVTPRIIPMIEIGYIGGHMHLLPSRQFSTAWNVTILYNMRKDVKLN